MSVRFSSFFLLYFFFFMSCRKAVSNREFGVFFFSGNCNGNYGAFPAMCPKTGYATLPTCCNVDGKTATVQSCACGEKTCQPDQLCTASTNTCADPVCSNTDGLKIFEVDKQCQCGESTCVAGQKCTMPEGNANGSCDYHDCRVGYAMSAKCRCSWDENHLIICNAGDTCTSKQRI